MIYALKSIFLGSDGPVSSIKSKVLQKSGHPHLKKRCLGPRGSRGTHDMRFRSYKDHT